MSGFVIFLYIEGNKSLILNTHTILKDTFKTEKFVVKGSVRINIINNYYSINSYKPKKNVDDLSSSETPKKQVEKKDTRTLLGNLKPQSSITNEPIENRDDKKKKISRPSFNLVLFIIGVAITLTNVLLRIFGY